MSRRRKKPRTLRVLRQYIRGRSSRRPPVPRWYHRCLPNFPARAFMALRSRPGTVLDPLVRKPPASLSRQPGVFLQGSKSRGANGSAVTTMRNGILVSGLTAPFSLHSYTTGSHNLRNCQRVSPPADRGWFAKASPLIDLSHWATGDKHPQYLFAALARLVEAGKLLPSAIQQLRRICA